MWLCEPKNPFRFVRPGSRRSVSVLNRSKLHLFAGPRTRLTHPTRYHLIPTLGDLSPTLKEAVL